MMRHLDQKGKKRTNFGVILPTGAIDACLHCQMDPELELLWGLTDLDQKGLLGEVWGLLGAEQEKYNNTNTLAGGEFISFTLTETLELMTKNSKVHQQYHKQVCVEACMFTATWHCTFIPSASSGVLLWRFDLASAPHLGQIQSR